MANFALINSENVVIHVSSVDNANLLDEKGQEQEAIGIAYLESVHKGKTRWPKTFDENGAVTDYYSDDELTWKQTSYNAQGGEGFRKNYAGKGFVFNSELDAFVPPAPALPEDIKAAAELVLNEQTCCYEVVDKLTKQPYVKK